MTSNRTSAMQMCLALFPPAGNGAILPLRELVPGRSSGGGFTATRGCKFVAQAASARGVRAWARTEPTRSGTSGLLA